MSTCAMVWISDSASHAHSYSTESTSDKAAPTQALARCSRSVFPGNPPGSVHVLSKRTILLSIRETAPVGDQNRLRLGILLRHVPESSLSLSILTVFKTSLPHVELKESGILRTSSSSSLSSVKSSTIHSIACASRSLRSSE